MGRVWDLPIPPDEKLLLLALADHADHNGENIRPGNRLLVEKTGFTERKIQRLLKRFLDSGLLTITEHAQGGRGMYRVYAMHPEYAPAPRAPRSGWSGRGAETKGEVIAPAAVTPIEDAPSESPDPGDDQQVQSLTASFARFWAVWPKPVEKKAALAQWRKLQPSPELVETIIAAVERHKLTRKWQEGYIKAPHRWLRDENWEDDVEADIVAINTALPSWVHLLPGETATQVGPDSWDLVDSTGRRRLIRPDYHGVIWDERKHRSSEGRRTFAALVERAKEGRQVA